MSSELDIDDCRAFLARRCIECDEARLRAAIAGKTILVTGAGGSIGSALVVKKEDNAIRGLHKVNRSAAGPGDFAMALAEVEETVRRRDVGALIHTLCRIVPDYQPSAVALESRRDSEA
jgi:FlaA1/EpsC-like NDP-sugar epimerase